MTFAIEDEVKVTLPPDAALPPLADERAGLVADAAPPVVLTSVYHDTEDRRLLAAGITVRRRTRGRTVTWEVKVPVRRDDIGQRREVVTAERTVAPPPAVTGLLAAWTGGDPLAPVATLRTRRLTWTIRDAHGVEVAEVVDDEVDHADGRRVLSRFREVELERRGVPEAYVARLLRRLAKAGGEPSATTKVGRVVAVPERVLVPRARPGGTVAALVTSVLHDAGQDLLLADVGARLREDDAVHQLRVACRRMRSILRGFGAALDPAWRDRLNDELRWVGAALAAARDAEVIAERLAVAADDMGATAEPLLADVATHRAAAEDAVVDVLASERYVALARLLRTELAAPPLADGGPGKPAREVARAVVAAAWRDLERAVRKARRKGAPDAAWHAVRIAAKRARYAAEGARPVTGGDVRRIARAATAVQDVLGVFHDAAGSVALLTELAGERADDTAYGVVAGRLVERELHAAAAARRAFGPVWRRAR